MAKMIINPALVFSAFTLLLGDPAFAADSEEDTAPAPGETLNDEAIVVTARRFEEKLRDVPIAITAYTQDQLTERNVTSANDIAAFTPSLVANPRFGIENSSFSIRGFIQDVFTMPTVGVYFAEAIAPRGASSITAGEGAGPGSFFDLQNVQVLKGPQGTLFGRNTTGGAILLVPRKPENAFGGYGEASFGNYNMTKFSAVLNVPVGEGGLRLGVEHMTRNGHLRNIGLGPARMNNVNYIAARASFLYPLSSNLENYIIGTYGKSDTVGFTPKPVVCDATRTSGTNNPPLGQPLLANGRSTGVIPSGRMSCESMARINATGDFWTVENPTTNSRSFMEQFQIINTTTWKASDSITVKNIFTYGELRNIANQDPLGTYWKINADDPNAGVNGRFGNFTGQVILSAESAIKPGLYGNNQSTLTEEVQIHGVHMDGRLDWQVGGYYEFSKTLDPYVGNQGRNALICTDVVALQCRSPYGYAAGSSLLSLRNTTYRDYGLYAQAIYKLTENLRLTAGIRYTSNSSRSLDKQIRYRFRSDGGVDTACASASAVLPDCVVVTPVGGGYYTTSAPTWLASIDYKPTENVLVYAKYARGYRQGTVDARSLDPYKTFGPERLDSYEIGGKADWRGAMPGAINVALFYNVFPKQQFLNTWADANGLTTTTAIANSAKSRSYGLEVDGGIEPARGFRLTGGFLWLNTKLLEVTPAGPGPAGFPLVVESEQIGRPFPFAAKFRLYAKAAFRLPIRESLGKLTVSVNFNHTSGYFASGRLLSWIDGWDTLGANMDWKDVGGQPIDVGLFATNLTQTKYYTYATDTLARLGNITKNLGEPRMFGLRAKIRFGSEAD
jgi:iron complex outermembrane recepter protein